MNERAELYRQIAGEAVQNYQSAIKQPMTQKEAIAVVDQQYALLNHGVAADRAGESLYMRYLGVLSTPERAS